MRPRYYTARNCNLHNTYRGRKADSCIFAGAKEQQTVDSNSDTLPLVATSSIALCLFNEPFNKVAQTLLRLFFSQLVMVSKVRSLLDFSQY